MLVDNILRDLFRIKTRKIPRPSSMERQTQRTLTVKETGELEPSYTKMTNRPSSVYYRCSESNLYI